jgi:hypothetical protein
MEWDTKAAAIPPYDLASVVDPRGYSSKTDVDGSERALGHLGQ